MIGKTNQGGNAELETKKKQGACRTKEEQRNIIQIKEKFCENLGHFAHECAEPKKV